MSSRSSLGSPLISQIERLPVYAQIEIMNKLSYISLKKLCRTSKYFADLCRHDYVRKILERRYNEKQKYLYVIGLQNGKVIAHDYPILYDYEKNILKIYQSETQVFMVLTNKRIPGLKNKPLKYEGQKYIEQIPDEYYKETQKGVRDPSTEKWYVLTNYFDEKTYNFSKNIFYPNDGGKFIQGWRIRVITNETTKEHFFERANSRIRR